MIAECGVRSAECGFETPMFAGCGVQAANDRSALRDVVVHADRDRSQNNTLPNRSSSTGFLSSKPPASKSANIE